jgi:hypothetical protein
MPGSKGLYQYTRDDGTVHYLVSLDKDIAAAAGFGAPDGTERALPKRYRLRHIICSWFSAGGAGQAVGKFTRSIPIPSVSNPLWNNTNTIQLSDYNSVPGAGQTTPNVQRPFSVSGRIGEKRPLGA